MWVKVTEQRSYLPEDSPGKGFLAQMAPDRGAVLAGSYAWMESKAHFGPLSATIRRLDRSGFPAHGIRNLFGSGLLGLKRDQRLQLVG